MRFPFKPFVLLACLVAGASAAPPNFKLPPLNHPATTVSLPGKFIWADLFTADVAASTKFYGELFGWEWRTFGSGPSAYHLASVAGEPVAGAVARPQVKGETAGAHWIGYISVPDIANAVQQVSAAGGRVLLAPRPVPDRGQLAVVADNEGTLFGVLQSSSGDPADYRAEAGEWDWAQLLAGDVKQAAGFYSTVFGYTLQESPRPKLEDNVYLVSGGFARAGVAKLPVHPDWKPVWLGFIRVTDVAATVAKAKALGGNVLADTITTPEGVQVAVISDPAGAPVGLVSMNRPQPVVK